MASRLTEGLSSGGPAIDLHTWCAETNAKPIMKRMSRWFHVIKADDVEKIDCLEGCDADNVRKVIAGKLDDFAGWPEARMNGYRRWLWSIAQAGMDEPIRQQLEREPA